MYKQQRQKFSPEVCARRADGDRAPGDLASGVVTGELFRCRPYRSTPPSTRLKNDIKCRRGRQWFKAYAAWLSSQC